MTKATPRATGKAIVKVRAASILGGCSVMGVVGSPVDVSFAKGAGREELATVTVTGDEEETEVENVLRVVVAEAIELEVGCDGTELVFDTVNGGVESVVIGLVVGEDSVADKMVDEKTLDD
jgi:hypothetical protein